MKKIILTIAAIASAACALSACGTSCNDKGGAKDKYQVLNDMLDKNYSSISITVTDNFDKDTSLKSEYTINYSASEITVDYKVERFAGISLDSTSTEVKKVYTGTATIKDGVVTGGEEVGLTADIAKTGFSFKEEYCINANITGMTFQANVKDASAFLGSQVTYTDMTVYAEFLEIFYNIEINYTQNGNKVKYEYTFNA